MCITKQASVVKRKPVEPLSASLAYEQMVIEHFPPPHQESGSIIYGNCFDKVACWTMGIMPIKIPRKVYTPTHAYTHWHFELSKISLGYKDFRKIDKCEAWYKRYSDSRNFA